MSAQATFWAQRQRPSGGLAAKLILLTLADIHNDHSGECRPKVATIAERCMLSERQTQRILKGLERDGLVARQARHSKRGGYQIANGYKLFITTAVVVKSPCAPRGDTGVRACAPRGDVGDGAMGVTSTSPLEPNIYEPSSGHGSQETAPPDRQQRSAEMRALARQVRAKGCGALDAQIAVTVPQVPSPDAPPQGASNEAGSGADRQREIGALIAAATRGTAANLHHHEPGTGRWAKMLAGRLPPTVAQNDATKNSTQARTEAR